MRYIIIDLSSDNDLEQPNLFGGYEGEHNETILQVKLPKRMIDIECSGYRFDFQTSEDNKIFSPLIPVSELNNDILSFHLTQQLTIAGKLLFNVVAILSDENTVSLISKTNTVTLRIEDAVDGNIQLIDPNGYKDELQKMVDERIMEINPAAVDQTYSPESENAQSGKAVAQALAGFEGGGSSSNGFSPIAKVEQTDEGATITITDKNGTTSATVKNGNDGKDGQNGKDGLSATHSWNGTVLTVTSASGTSSANLKGEKGDKGDPGEQGANGSNGKDGTSVTVKSVSESTADGGSNVVTFSDGKTLTIKNGSNGDSVPDYWVEELEAKADAIQTAMEKAGRNKSAFLWYTDAHWANGNSKVSPSLLNYLYMNTPMNKVNFGGDIIGNSLLATREEMKYLYEWRKAIKNLPNHHSVLGNHDMFSSDSVDYEDDNYRYTMLIAPEESSDMVMGNGNYYYIDNHSEKTRYLYLCYPNTVQADLMAQGEFIVNALKTTPENWHIVVISHRWFQYSSSSTPTTGVVSAFEKDILSVFDAYNARGTRSGSNYFYAQDFTEAKGKVEFCIGGHIHVDYDFESEGGIPVIITTADTNQNRVPDSTVDSGTVGTTTEAAVFGIVADYNEETTKITVVGVGRGTSRVVRNSSVKVSSISDITYLGDTTVGATIDKSKFTFTVNYSNGTTDTITGATSVSPATIGVVGNNTVTISYTEGTTTVSGTTTIVGTPVPVANLLNLDRTYVSGAEGENIGAHFDTSKAYLNVIYGNGAFDAKSCTVSDITENGVTVKESGRGGVYVGYPIDASGLNTNNIRVTFDYSGTGKCRTNWTYISPNSGVAAGAKPIFMNDSAGASGSVDVTIDRQGVDQIIIYFGSNTSGTKTYSNISVTAAD